MKVIKPQLLGALHRTFEHDHTHYLVVTTMAAFRLTSPRKLVQEPLLWRAASDELGRDGVLDLGMSKQHGELLVTGRAYAHGGPQPAVQVRVRLGPIDKSLTVVGDRHWERNGSSPPVPFVEMPVSWRTAFGGEKVPENPVGKGAAPITLDDREVHPLPNVEDPSALVKTPRDRPTPAGFAPTDITWPQRFSKMGTYDSAWFKEVFPGLARDLDWTVFQSAPRDQWLPGWFSGDEEFSIQNMHPSIRTLEGRLPGYRGRAFIRQRTSEALRELETRVDTVHLFPHRDLGMLVFRGMLTVDEDDAADVSVLLVGCEDAAAPRTVAHYEEVLARRLARKGGALAALQDHDLVPGEQASIGDLLKELRPDHEPSEHLGHANRRRGLERQMESAREKLRARGFDLEKHLPPLPPDIDLDMDVDEALAGAGDMRRQIDALKADALAAKAAHEVEAKQKLAAHGVDYAEVMAKSAKDGGGPPQMDLEARIEAARTELEVAKGKGFEVKGADAALVRVEGQLKQARDHAWKVYRRYAQHFPEVDELDEDESARARVRIELGAKEGVAFAGCDFTGADLRGLVAKGVDLRGAFLERANLEGADLEGALLEETVLTRANLRGANLRGARARLVNLAAATLHGADFEGADLTQAILVGARFKETRLVGAELKKANFLDADPADSDFSGARLAGARFLKNSFARTRFAGADLERALFLETDLTGADFTGAMLERASFMTVKGAGAIFVEARGARMRVAKDSDLSGADFSRAVLSRANLRSTALDRANFSDARLDEADLSESHATGATFARAYARKARFMKTNLDAADMSQIDLLGGSLMKASLRGTSFVDANLFAVDFARSVGDTATSMKGANVKRTRVTPKRPDGSG
ncbi:MAG TPA: DUF2169 domain-containing protein [Byssovorax sp.]